MMKINMGGAIASAAAMLAVNALATAAFAQDIPAGSSGLAVKGSDTVHCYGVNTCQGTADCATTTHECKGHNSCRGQGFKAMAASACLAADGTIGDLK